MNYKLAPDFFIATLIDAEHKRKAEKIEAERKTDELILNQSKKSRDDAIDLQTALAVVVVSELTAHELETLNIRLTEHQNAVFEALNENREQLNASEDRLEEMLGKAIVLDDGRRVFKTSDGLRVFDENGLEVGADKIMPDEIENWRPDFETYADERETLKSLKAAQTELLRYQQKLDDAQERVEQGGLTREEFNDLNSLLNEAPTAVRSRLSPEDSASLSTDPDIDANQVAPMTSMEEFTLDL